MVLINSDNALPISHIFKLEIGRTFLISEIKGIKTNAFNKISTSSKITNNYRTYDWLEAKTSTVFLEPVILPEEFKEMLLERQFGWIREAVSAT